MNQQQFERALNLFRRAYAADSRLTEARLNQGIALLNLQRFTAARQILTDMAKREPRNPRPWYNLGLLHKAQGETDAALKAFQRAAQLEPQDTDIFYFIGSMYSQVGDERRAAAAFRKALELAPEHASAEFGLARSYQRLKEQDKAKAHLARFEQITKTKQGKLMSLAYGDQGLLSLAVQAGGVQSVPAPVKVTFTDATSESGLSQLTGARAPQDDAQPVSSPAACWLDFDGDARHDILFMQAGPAKRIRLFRNADGNVFKDATASTGLNPETVGFACAAADFDNDGHTDLALATGSGFRLLRNSGSGRFADVTSKTAIARQHAPAGLMFVDFDHDGDADLYLLSDKSVPELPDRTPDGSAPNVLLRNNGNGSFTDVTPELGVAGEGGSLAALASDVNNDRAVDLVIAGQPLKVLFNPREGRWRHESPFSAAPGSRALGMALLDFDKDGSMDLAFTYSGEPYIALWRNVEGNKFERVPLRSSLWLRASGIVAADYDNDGWIDLIAAGQTPGNAGTLRIFRNGGPKGFQDVTASVGLTKMNLSHPRGLLAADYDNDGDTDLLVTQEDGHPILLRNDGGNRNNFLKISLRGLADNRSAIGTKIEVFAGGLRQKWEVSPAALLGQNSTEIIAGLGQEKSVDVVRLLWPTGVVQDEAELSARTTRKITEIDRRGSSCPVLFAWDGTGYRFITDMLGAGVVGHWISPTQKNTPDPTEYLKIQGVIPALKDGRLSFRLLEPMEEVVYLDQVRLLAVDHPSTIAVYPNEYFASTPPFASFKVVASRDARPPAAALDDTGRDVLPLLLTKDRRYVTSLELLPWLGFTKPHTLTLDLTQPYKGGPLRLLMTGYIEYFMANSMYAAYQAGVEPFAPYLEAQRPDGTWLRVIDDVGFPAGLYRTMTADLTEKLPPGTRSIRLTTNLQIYWDQILVDTTRDADVALRIAEVPLASANLAFHGYPRMRELDTPGDLMFDYEDVSRSGPYLRQAGSYTRFGEVTGLVTASDDRFVTFGSGEEVQLEFDPSNLPQLPHGWARDYFFFADGFEKDMDFYAADGTTVLPLPFHRMTTYPYSGAEQYPDSPEHLEYRLNYNTRHDSGGWPASLQFDFDQEKAAAEKLAHPTDRCCSAGAPGIQL